MSVLHLKLLTFLVALLVCGFSQKPLRCNEPNTERLRCQLMGKRHCGNRQPTAVLASACTGGCHCLPGFVRDKQGACVSDSTCLPNCPPGCPSWFDGCNKCTGTTQRCACTRRACSDATWRPQMCNCGTNKTYSTAGPCITPCGEPGPRNCLVAGPPGCYCSDPINMRSLPDGRCVLTADCPTVTPCPACRRPRCNNGGVITTPRIRCTCPTCDCGRLQIYKRCGTACEPTCKNPKPFCTKRCVEGCFCRPGLFRDTISGLCVTSAMCKVAKGKCQRREHMVDTQTLVDKTQFRNCVPPTIDVGTCRGDCNPSTKICVPRVNTNGVFNMTCRDITSSTRPRVSVSVDFVRSCRCF